ncbi:MAG: Fic family protein [Euzebya sp.]
MQFSYSHQLVQLVARVEAASTRLAAADPDQRAQLASQSRRAAAFASARLDGSPLTQATAAEVDDGRVPHLAELPPDPGVGWARALRLESMETQEVAALEYANLRGLVQVEADLADVALRHPLDTIGRLHGLICQGLVDPDVIAVPRTTDQAVHDGGQGMVIYNAPAPAEVSPLLAELDQWLRRRTLVLHPAITAGIAHERLLHIQPFEAGNGRVARAFTRIVLHSLGVDPHGVAVVEEQLWADATGYYGEVAATVRRQGDLSRWLERHTAALARALEQAADQLDPRPRPGLPERGRGIVQDLPPGRIINLREYAQDVGVELRVARQDLTAFARAGMLREVADGGGLAFQRPTPPQEWTAR